MRKLLIVGIALIVIAAAVAVLLLNLNGIVNKNKDFFIGRAESTIGRDIDVGTIGVTLRGGIGVRLTDVRVADDPAFSDEPFLEASDLQVNAKLLPLLRKQFEVKRVILRHPVIRVVRDAGGQFNFMSLTNPKGTASEQEGTGDGGKAAAVPLVVSLASIEDGAVHYTDQKTAMSIQVTKIKSSVKDLDFDKPISTNIEAAVFSDTKNFEIKTTFGPVDTEQPDPFEIPIQAEIDLEPIDVTRLFEAFPELKNKLPAEYSTGGTAVVHLTASGRAADATVTFDIDGSQLYLRGPQGFEKAAGLGLGLKGQSRFAGDVLELNDVSLTFGSLQAQIIGEYRLGPPPSIDLNIESKQVGLNGWDKVVPMLATYALSGIADINAHIDGNLERGSAPGFSGAAKIVDGSVTLPQYTKPLTGINANVTFDRNQAEIPDFSFRIGESTLEGNATVESLDNPVIIYSARSPAIALADIQPPKPNITKPEILKDVTAQGRQIPGDVPGGSGKLTSRSGSIANFDYNNLSAAYSIAGPKITISDLVVETLGGRLTGDGVVTTGEQSMAFDIHAKARQVDITEMFEALPGSIRRSLTGSANLDLNISGTGTKWEDIKHTLSGDGLAEMLNGEVLEWNVAKNFFGEIEQFAGSNVISNQVKAKYPGVFARPNTEFKNIKSDFAVKDGKLLARNLLLTHKDYTIKGKGALDFDKGLDLRTSFIVSKDLSADLIGQYKAAQYLANSQGQIEVPVFLSGTLPNVSARPDSDYLRSVMSKAFVNEGLDILKKNNLQDLLPFGKKKDSKPDSTKK